MIDDEGNGTKKPKEKKKQDDLAKYLKKKTKKLRYMDILIFQKNTWVLVNWRRPCIMMWGGIGLDGSFSNEGVERSSCFSSCLQGIGGI